MKTLCVKVKKEEAEKAKRKLQERGLLDHSFSPKAVGRFVFFPVTGTTKGLKVVECVLEKREQRPRSLAEALQQSGVEPSGILSSFDIVGDIAIVEIPRELSKRKGIERKIANAIMAVHPGIKTVAKKGGPISGVYRTRKLKVIAGKRTTETIHTESGCRFKLDVSKAYFSPRLSFERQRISSLVKPGETVFVPFAGVGPFATVIAKAHPDAKVYANELNPAAFRYLEENIRLNKTWNVYPLKGDARKVARAFPGVADRVVMPIPMSAPQFLDVAFALAKRDAIVHFYHFTESEEKAVETIKRFAQRHRKKIRVFGTRIVRRYSPSIVEVVVDFKVAR